MPIAERHPLRHKESLSKREGGSGDGHRWDIVAFSNQVGHRLAGRKYVMHDVVHRGVPKQSRAHSHGLIRRLFELSQALTNGRADVFRRQTAQQTRYTVLAKLGWN